MNKKQKVLILSGAVAFTAVLVAGGVLGLNALVSPSTAGGELPSAVRGEEIGEGGIDPSTVVLAADSQRYQVWTARDRAGNYCTVSYAIPEGNSAAVCSPEDMLETQGVSSSMQVGTAEEGDANAVFLQAYLLPESVDPQSAQRAVQGAEAYGQVLVRYGQVDQRGSAIIDIPAGTGGAVSLNVLGSE